LLLDKPQKERPDKDAEIRQVIIRICIQFPTYGYRRVTAVLRNRLGRAINRKKVQRIMQEEGLTAPVKERKSEAHQRIRPHPGDSLKRTFPG